jgi:HSP20 family molecular chaperone IbpA
MSLSLAEHPFSNLARQAGKMMDQMQKGFYVYSSDTWTPNVNLYETANTYLVCVDLAGVQKEKIDVEVADQRLKLRGARAVPTYEPDPPPPAAKEPPRRATKPGKAGSHEGDGGGGHAAGEAGSASEAGDRPQHPEPHAHRLRVHLMEIDHGPFTREVELPPDADKAGITASYRNGMLWIEIPKT